jgi:hypothetical protein
MTPWLENMRLKLLLPTIPYIDKENANAHDILLCVREGEKTAYCFDH